MGNSESASFSESVSIASTNIKQQSNGASNSVSKADPDKVREAFLYLQDEGLISRNPPVIQIRYFPMAADQLYIKMFNEEKIRLLSDVEVTGDDYKRLGRAKTVAEKAEIFRSIDQNTQPDTSILKTKCLSRLKTRAFAESFLRECENLMDVDYIWQQLTTADFNIEKERTLLEVQGIPRDEVNKRMEQRRHEIDSYSKFAVRILITNLQKTDKLGAFFASIFTPFGMNHVSLQVGPNFVHWHAGNLATIHPLRGEKQATVAAIYPRYPSTESMTNRNSLRELAKVIVAYNSKTYDNLMCNCHHFVMDCLKALNLQPTWIPGGPIKKFLKPIKKAQSTPTSLQIFDPHGNKVIISSLAQLQNYAETYKEALASISDQKTAMEFEEVLRCAVRAFQLQGSAASDAVASSNIKSTIVSISQQQSASNSMGGLLSSLFNKGNKYNAWTEGI